jgi:hypothetical protein
LKALRIFVVPVLACALLLSGTNSAQAAGATRNANVERSTVDQASFTDAEARAIQARAVEVYNSVYKSLQATGSATYTTPDGKTQTITLGGLQAAQIGTASAASIGCRLKVGAALAVLAGVGAGFIAWMITGLAIGTSVLIAGLKLTAGTWSTIAYLMTVGGALAAYLEVVLC